MKYSIDASALRRQKPEQLTYSTCRVTRHLIREKLSGNGSHVPVYKGRPIPKTSHSGVSRKSESLSEFCGSVLLQVDLSHYYAQ